MDKAANRKVHHRRGVLSTPIHSSTDRQHLPSREIMQVIGYAGAAGDDINQPAGHIDCGGDSNIKNYIRFGNFLSSFIRNLYELAK